MNHGGKTTPQHWQPLGGKENDLRSLDVLERTVSIADDGEQPLTIFGANNDVDGLGHRPRFAHPAEPVNPVSVSVH
jgi:hypothetical protein